MGNTLEHFDPASEGFALVLESLDAAGMYLCADTQGDAGDEPASS